MPEALDAVVPTHDQTGAERTHPLEGSRDARLYLDVELTRDPLPDRALQRGRRVDGERGQPFLFCRIERQPQLDELVVDVDAEPTDPRRRRAGELLRDACESAGLIPVDAVKLEPIETGFRPEPR